jgi:short-subunit dehydrogenase
LHDAEKAGKDKKIKMTDFLRRFGQWGIVAGAAEGIGAAFCEEMARKGMNVIMVDINKVEMESLSSHLESTYDILTRRLVIDLADETSPDLIMKALNEADCRLLVYNAAYSRVKPFLLADPEELDLYINVNSRSPLKLIHAFAQKLKTEQKSGGILLMSSLAGLWGTKLVAAYSGTKAFNLALAEALSHELKPWLIDVSACCAGATATPGYLGTNPSYRFIRPSVMRPEKVASIALNKLGKKTVIIPGFSNRLTYFLLTRILPRSVSVALVNRTMGRTYRNF